MPNPASNTLRSDLQREFDLFYLCNSNINFGGFYQDQVQMALRATLVEHEKTVYIPEIADIIGEKARINCKDLYQNGFKQIGFTLQSTNEHQVAVWVSLGAEQQDVRVYDSRTPANLPEDKKAWLQQLLGLNADDSIALLPSIFNPQADSWSCGVFVFATLARLAGHYNSLFASDQLDVIPVARYLYKTYKQEEQRSITLESEKQTNRQQTALLLDIIERYRDTKGVYDSASDEPKVDALKNLADYLQQIYWGNLDRRPLSTEQNGRMMEALPLHHGLSFQALLANYDNKDDPLVSLILKLASHCPDLNTFQWKPLFELVERANNEIENSYVKSVYRIPKADVNRRIARDIAYLISSEITSQQYPSAQLWDMLEMILNKCSPSMSDALQTILQTVFKEDADHYAAGFETSGGFILANASCLELINWLNCQIEPCANSQEAAQRRIEAEKKAATLALHSWCNGKLEMFGLDETERTELLHEVILKPDLRVLLSLLPTDDFKALDTEIKKTVIQFLFQAPSFPREEKNFLEQAILALPLDDESFYPVFKKWMLEFIAKDFLIAWRWLIEEDILSLLHSGEMNLTHFEGLHTYLSDRTTATCLLYAYALRDKLFTLDQLAQVTEEALPVRNLLLSAQGLSFLQERLFSFEFLIRQNLDTVKNLMSIEILDALKKGLCDPALLTRFSPQLLNYYLNLPIYILLNLIPSFNQLFIDFFTKAINVVHDEKSFVDFAVQTLPLHDEEFRLVFTKWIRYMNTKDLLLSWSLFQSELAIKALLDGQFKLDEYEHIAVSWFSDNSYESCELFLQLCRQNRISKDIVLSLPEITRQVLLSEAGLQSLQKNIISIRDMLALPKPVLPMLLSTEVINELLNGRLSLEPFYELSEDAIWFMLKEPVWAKIVTGAFKWQDLGKLPSELFERLNPSNTINYLLSTRVLTLHDLLILPEIAIDVMTNARVTTLLIHDQITVKDVLYFIQQGLTRETIINLLLRLRTSILIKGLQDQLFTYEQLASLSKERFKLLRSSAGLNALRLNVLSIKHFEALPSALIKVLLTETGMEFLQKTSFSLAELEKLPDFMLNKKGLYLIQNGIITRSDLFSAVFVSLLSPITMKFLRQGTLSTTDLKAVTPDRIINLKTLFARLDTVIELHPYIRALIALSLEKIALIARSYEAASILKSYISVEEIQRLSADRLALIFSNSGFVLLRNKLLTIDDIENEPVNSLSFIFQNYEAFRRGVISFSSIKGLSADKLQIIFTYKGYEMLGRGLLTIADIKRLPIEKLTLICNRLSRDAQDILRDRLLSISDMERLPTKKLQHILNPAGYVMLLNKVVTISDIERLSTSKLQLIFTSSGYNILQSKLLSISDIERLRADKLQVILGPEAYKTWYDKLLSISDIERLQTEKLSICFSLHGRELLRSKRISVDEIDSLPLNKLALLNSYNGLTILEGSYITIDDLIKLPEPWARKLLDLMSNIWGTGSINRSGHLSINAQNNPLKTLYLFTTLSFINLNQVDAWETWWNSAKTMLEIDETLLNQLVDQLTTLDLSASNLMIGLLLEKRMPGMIESEEKPVEYWEKRFHDAITSYKKAALTPKFRPLVEFLLERMLATTTIPSVKERLEALNRSPLVFTSLRPGFFHVWGSHDTPNMSFPPSQDMLRSDNPASGNLQRKPNNAFD